MENEQREFQIDRLTLKRLRTQYAMSIDKFAEKAGINISTAKKMSRGGRVTLTVIGLAAKVFGITNHHELLHPDELRALGVAPVISVPTKYVEAWEIENYLSPWERTANGLQFCVAKLRHRYLKEPTEPLARGKCYWLRHLPVGERERLEVELRRHPSICQRFAEHPNIAMNITATFVDDGGLWWVLDRWVEGPTLTEKLKNGRLEAVDLKTVMMGIGQGLLALHREKIVRRELSPRFVIVRAQDGCPVLTDFELAKLLDGKTVAPKDGWHDDPYRAIEVAGDAPIDQRADVFSWGRIFVEAATGELSAKGEEAKHIQPLTIPETLKQMVVKCVAKPRSDRPAGMEAVLDALKRWTP
jgi:serine/threonine protein kinase